MMLPLSFQITKLQNEDKAERILTEKYNNRRHHRRVLPNIWHHHNNKGSPL